MIVESKKYLYHAGGVWFRGQAIKQKNTIEKEGIYEKVKERIK